MATIGENVTGGTAGSVLFIDSNVQLAQDNNDFYYDPNSNTLKTKDQPTSASSNFSVATGDVTGGNSSSGSGTLTVKSGGGSANSSGAPAGSSGTVTIATGPGGAASGGSAPGASGNLFLKTGTGGGNAAPSSTGGNAGHIILQPGSGGSGTAGTGAGGSTIVRASNSGDILAVQNSAGTTTHLGVANNGNVRVGAPSSTARLHLGAGTSTLPPLKFTAGTNLTSPQAGAMEFDGSALFFTAGTIRRTLETSLEVANVLDFGAKGDGNNDDAGAFQAAFDSLAQTGGIVWVPPGKTYQIGSKVVIRCPYPIWMQSGMGNRGLAGATGQTHADSALIRPDGNLTYMFEWARPTTSGFETMAPAAVAESKELPLAIGRVPVHSMRARR
jgi:hypothetical protein